MSTASNAEGTSAEGTSAEGTSAESGNGDGTPADTPDTTASAKRVRTIAEVLADARARLERVPPERAHAEHSAGALLVDIRPAAQRAVEGSVPGAVVIERNVLEWRLDPASDARLPVASHDLRVLVLCSEGYTSSLAAASLLDLGIAGATDVEGGFAAWRAAGLPSTP
jgi:rhodanese-related sulfurtransferase